MSIILRPTTYFNIGTYDDTGGSVFLVDENDLSDTQIKIVAPVNEPISATVRYTVTPGYKLSEITLTNKSGTQLASLSIDSTESGQVSTPEVVIQETGTRYVIVTPTFEEVPTEGGQMIMSTLQDQSGKSYNIKDIETIKGSKGGGPFVMNDVDTISCGDKTYTIEHHGITV